jgi:hypothetical protein
MIGSTLLKIMSSLAFVILLSIEVEPTNKKRARPATLASELKKLGLFSRVSFTVSMKY